MEKNYNDRLCPSKRIQISLYILLGLSIIIIILDSCSKRDDFADFLANNNACWIYYDDPQAQIGNENFQVTGCIKFNEDRTFDNLLFNGEKIRQFKAMDKVTENANVWSYSPGDSTFNVAGNNFKIVRYYSDTLVLVDEFQHIKKMVKWTE